ncbi:PREDICTED: hydroxylysine kinase isoform X2 [Polistes dominula]|nr:PREDICTED: hydroxylysine kinase isoform X2 [Polistes dominula]
MEKTNTLLSPGQRIRPNTNEKTAIELLFKIYGITVTDINELNAYDDRNYHIHCTKSHDNPYISEISEHGYVFKIINLLDSRNTQVIEAQTEMLIFLKGYFKCPIPVKNLTGAYYSSEKINNSEESYVIRLFIYQPGQLLSRVKYLSKELLFKVGHLTADLDTRLSKFYHPAYEHHRSMWMLISVPKLHSFVYAVPDETQRELASAVIRTFENDVLKFVPILEQGMIHGDLNEQNILINDDGTDIIAIIDFGDSQKTCLIFELAIAICYMLLQSKDIAECKHVIEGYQSIRKLTYLEKKILKVSVCARICQSLVMGAYSYLNDPKNKYLLTTQKTGWTLLEKLWPMTEEEIFNVWDLQYSN